ncbi:GH36-type glycosyl hydrolase domain-containing protein [Anaeromicropila populeti]|uniref:Cellobiose phosphorylase n=1 Tax=Anaeromicropila populeti TaxID=37658 RepID=A0A1I6L1F4_9FIRM|nr:N,N'-diacetylchitobiose phosphorylase [Anaeromicropila populeti]SFR97271.1 Cellobiose phosphorylase [Anaeromicropila populeti]
MNYGYFDDANKEYVITRPDTPTPWTNYLGSTEYGAIITNNAAGYSFIGSGANGKLLRFRFNACYSNLPGRYIYISDQESKDYWSASWQPVGKSLENYQTICRHGTAYTEITSQYQNIETSTLYYVPLHQQYEIWHFKVKNMDTVTRNLSIFAYSELTNHKLEAMDMNNLQYSQYISRTYYKDNHLMQYTNGLSDDGCWRFFGVSKASAVGWDGSREGFLGTYGSYSTPSAVINGACNQTLNYTGNSCGSLQVNVNLEPQEENEMVFILGEGTDEMASQLLNHYKNARVVQEELFQLKQYWHSKLEAFQVQTPDSKFNSMINVWHSYECFVNTYWSRTASLIYSSGRNGLGYRDTVADLQSIMHLDHKLAGERLVTLLSGQVSNGGALPLVRFDHIPGTEFLPDSPEYQQKTGYDNYRCDDGLWLFEAVLQYIKESGKVEFLDTIIPYSDTGKATVYEHLKKALEFLLARLGEHHLLIAIDNDWNDCLKLGSQGESVFASFQLYLGLKIFQELAHLIHKDKDLIWAESHAKELYSSLQTHCFQDGQFIRAITKDHHVIGASTNEEASLWLNPQTWSVISGVASPKQAEEVLDKVDKILKTEYGALLFYPSYTSFKLPEINMAVYLPGVKENGSIFLMAEAWIIKAETMLGHGNQAWDYFNSTNPASYNDKCELHQTEPYVYSQFVEGIESPYYGRAHGHWLTGSASSIMLSVVEGILGVRADYDGLIVQPCIPSKWEEFSIVRHFRNKTLHIHVCNPDHVEKGVTKIVLNGEEFINSCFIPLCKMKELNEVEIIMG